MLTKTRKWLFVFVLAIAAVFLAACKEKVVEEVTKPEPTTIEISLDTYEGNKGVLIGGDKMELSIIATPSDANKTVIWSSADSSIATVSQDGKVTGVKAGKVKIQAVSVLNNAITAEVEIMVYSNLEDVKVVLKTMDYIKTELPVYATEDFILPQDNNPLVKVEYFYSDGSKVKDNLYKHVYEKDSIESLNVKVSYLEEVLEFPVTILVVQDANFNEFEAVNSAKEFVNDFLKPYKSDRVRENVALPTSHTFAVGENTKTVAISWTSPIPTVFSNEGIFNRPNDDTVISLEAYFTCGNVSQVSRSPIVLNGYTQAEKMEYLKANVLPKVTEIEGANIFLALRDTKFGTTIVWTSSNAPVLSAAGKMYPYLDVATNVKLTATVKYPGTLNASFAFEETIEFPILVKPAVNDAQKVALDFGNSLEGVLPTYFPYGLKTREGNTIPLPVKVGGEGTYKDIDVTWASSEAGLFNDKWELQKQYLRFHEVTLTFSLTVGEATATGEVKVNVGVAKSANTIYIGGDTYSKPSFDEIHTFSKADAAVGTTTSVYQEALGGWSGITFYRDITTANGSVVRYQFMLVDRYVFEFNEKNTVVAEDGKISLADPKKPIATNTGHSTSATNRYKLFYNNTGKDIKIPVAFLNYKGSSYINDVNGNGLNRHGGMNFDGWRTNFVLDGSGKIVFGYGNVVMETGMLAEAEATKQPMKDHAVIPAGGIGFSANQNSELAALGDIFMQQPVLVDGTMVYGQCVIEHFTPII